MRPGRPAKYKVKLSEEEKKELKGRLKKGKHAARKLKRAHILLLSDEGKKQEEIESILKVSGPTICCIKKRYCEEGLSAALEERPRPGAKGKLDAKGDVFLSHWRVVTRQKDEKAGPCSF